MKDYDLWRDKGFTDATRPVWLDEFTGDMKTIFTEDTSKAIGMKVFSNWYKSPEDEDIKTYGVRINKREK